MTMADGPLRRPSRSPRAQGLCKVTVLVPEDCADDVRQFAQQLRDRQPNGRVPETPKWRVISPSAELMGAGLGVHGPTATAACISRPGRRPNPKSGRPQQPLALPPRGRSRRSRYPKRCRPLPQSRPLEAFEHRCLARTLHSPLAEENRGDGYRATTQAYGFLSNVNHFTY